MDMTVMTFNLRYPTPKDGPDYWPNRIGKAASVILENRPLVFGTQEGYHTMIVDLEPFLEQYAWIGNGRLGEHENEHCAIFYDKRELELSEHGQFWLSETPEQVASKSWDSMLPRICTWARFVHRENGSSFYVYNTHLDHSGKEARVRGCRLIWERIRTQRKHNGIPAILMGDFNSVPSDWPIRFLRGETTDGDIVSDLTDAYSILPGNPGLTAHSFKGGHEGNPIDYIFTTPEFRILEAHVDRSQIGDGYPSDHYPIVARLQLDCGAR
jgi:endonuclease/exonuclease/phosphatase family metal-dependent hydrolase